jgi:hypothetical protein
VSFLAFSYHSSNAFRRATTEASSRLYTAAFAWANSRKLLNYAGRRISHGELPAYVGRCCSPGEHSVRRACPRQTRHLILLIQPPNLVSTRERMKGGRTLKPGKATATADCGRRRVREPPSTYVLLRSSPAVHLNEHHTSQVFWITNAFFTRHSHLLLKPQQS